MANSPHPFSFGVKVIADKSEIEMVVTAFTYRHGDQILVECQYWHNGDLKTVSIPFWRLRLAIDPSEL